MTEPFMITEAVILVRQGGTTMAVHVPSIVLRLTAIVNEPDLPNAPLYFVPPTTIEGYEVEATGVADRLTIWQGPDPFERQALDSPLGAIE